MCFDSVPNRSDDVLRSLPKSLGCSRAVADEDPKEERDTPLYILSKGVHNADHVRRESMFCAFDSSSDSVLIDERTGDKRHISTMSLVNRGASSLMSLENEDEIYSGGEGGIRNTSPL